MIINDENRLLSAMNAGLLISPRRGLRFGPNGQIYREHGAVSGFALKPDMSAGLFDEPIYCCKSESSACLAILGTKERPRKTCPWLSYSIPTPVSRIWSST